MHPHAPFGVLLFRPSASADDEFTVQPFDDVALRGGQRVAGYLDRPGAWVGARLCHLSRFRGQLAWRREPPIQRDAHER